MKLITLFLIRFSLFFWYDYLVIREKQILD